MLQRSGWRYRPFLLKLQPEMRFPIRRLTRARHRYQKRLLHASILLIGFMLPHFTGRPYGYSLLPDD